MNSNEGNCESIFLVGTISEELDDSKLPSNGDALRLFYYYRRVKKLSIKLAMTTVYDRIKRVWDEKMSTGYNYDIKNFRLLTALLDQLKACWKNINKPYLCAMKQRNEFRKIMEALFDLRSSLTEEDDAFEEFGDDGELNLMGESLYESDGENDEQDDEEKYEIEKILRKRTNPNGSTSYFIKWLGYPEAENTWEPEENIKDCTDALTEFAEEQCRLKGEECKKLELDYNENIESLSTLSKSNNAVVESSVDKPEQSNSIEIDDELATMNGIEINLNRTCEPNSATSPPELKEINAKKALSETDQRKPLTLEEMEKSVFDQGFRPERIIGISNIGNTVQCLLKLEGQDEPTFVTTSELGARYPNFLIDFYENSIIFEDLN